MNQLLVLGSVAGVVILVAGGIALTRTRGARARAGSGAPGQATVGLREAVLSRQILTGQTPDTSGRMRCALMDWGAGGGVATLAAFDDGTVSLYTSTGGGIIGAGSHETVRTAATAFRATVEQVRARFSPQTDYAVPGPDTVVFWAVTGEHTYSSGPVSVAQLQQGNFWLTAAGNAAQATISRLRQASP